MTLTAASRHRLAAAKRKQLLDLAFEVAGGRHTWHTGSLIAHLYADATCPDIDGTFGRLVAHVREFIRFAENETAWLQAHRIVADDETHHTYSTVIQERICVALDELLDLPRAA